MNSKDNAYENIFRINPDTELCRALSIFEDERDDRRSDIRL